MKKLTWNMATLLGIGVGMSFLMNCGHKSASPSAQEAHYVKVSDATEDPSELIARGAYLVTSAGCNDCHSPKLFSDKGEHLIDNSRMLSGHPANAPLPTFKVELLKDWVLFNQDFTAAVGPWGTSFAANITSDPTGIGTWKEEQFIRALREGKYKGLENGRPLLPPMPWPNFAQLSDGDLKAIFAYLMSTPPVHNVVPAPIPPAKPVQ